MSPSESMSPKSVSVHQLMNPPPGSTMLAGIGRSGAAQTHPARLGLVLVEAQAARLGPAHVHPPEVGLVDDVGRVGHVQVQVPVGVEVDELHVAAPVRDVREARRRLVREGAHAARLEPALVDPDAVAVVAAVPAVGEDRVEVAVQIHVAEVHVLGEGGVEGRPLRDVGGVVDEALGSGLETAGSHGERRQQGGESSHVVLGSLVAAAPATARPPGRGRVDRFSFTRRARPAPRGEHRPSWLSGAG